MEQKEAVSRWELSHQHGTDGCCQQVRVEVTTMEQKETVSRWDWRSSQWNRRKLSAGESGGHLHGTEREAVSRWELRSPLSAWNRRRLSGGERGGHFYIKNNIKKAALRADLIDKSCVWLIDLSFPYSLHKYLQTIPQCHSFSLLFPCIQPTSFLSSYSIPT